MNKRTHVDKKRIIQQTRHLTSPPRLEGVVKNVGIKPIRKNKKQRS